MVKNTIQLFILVILSTYSDVSSASLFRRHVGQNINKIENRPECETVLPWLTSREENDNNNQKSTTAQRAQAQKKELEFRRQAVELSFQEVYRQKNTLAQIKKCLKDARSNQEINFTEAYQGFSVNQAIHSLSKITGNSAKFLYEKIQAVEATGRISLIRFTDEDTSPTELKAGFNAATGDLFFDMSKISLDEFNVIVIHEYIHWLDEKLYSANEKYNDPVTLAKVAAIAKKYPSLKELPPDDKKIIEDWILAGLNRGLWAEIRAWVPTLEIYQAAIQSGTWRQVEWADEVLKTRIGNEEIKETVFRYLIQNAINPKDEIFSYPLIQEALKEKRNSRDALNF